VPINEREQQTIIMKRRRRALTIKQIYLYTSAKFTRTLDEFTGVQNPNSSTNALCTAVLVQADSCIDLGSELCKKVVQNLTNIIVASTHN